ncbi:HAMP domain-containing sensor histidine kinase [Sporomusa sp.]|uniref:HAMP domain-containing sensor histidine kinase n=1 Tax=Sporomusa sp. TaxID=2078658 RepID=UPI002C183ED3|nr:HAMP domain-containing sensor histidine kinase [Sporomusa sp.]HWR45146.1 HAMP domain-containing sensor histidine kinase [Sporomusa sp.]
MFRHKKHHELHAHFRRLHDARGHHGQFLRHYKYFRYLRPAFFLFNLLILYLLFSWIGIKEVAIFFAVVIGLKELIQLLFLLRLEKRIFKPMEQLRQGLDEVAKGNYSIKLEYDKPNDLELLMAAFNTMTEKLYESEKLQAEYEANRKALVANISHDLKTPITAIQGYIEALIEGTVTSVESQNKYLKTIHHNTAYVNKLIDDLFLFSKLDMQKLDLHFERVQIRQFMQDLMEEYELDLAEQKIGFQYSEHLETDYWLDLDAKRFRQALNNLINNAVKHGPDTDLAIEVRLYHQDDSICVDIRDNGPGIPEDKLPFIFDRFYRINAERTKDYSSTGLGLAIAKELIEAHQGKITVSSLRQEGTCFTIRLSVLQDNEGETYP